MLANAADWEWTFFLKPRLVKIEAPGWTVSGVRPDGVPEQQVFFAPQQKATASQASYERQELQTLAQVDRHVELGLIGQVRAVVTRLSPLGKAVALRVPLLPGENVLTANAVVRDGAIEVRLGAQEGSFSWDSGLTLANQLQLTTRTNDVWVERWELVASPVWNVSFSGLEPTFENLEGQLVPLWQPWPGESAAMTVSRPEAVAGAAVTIDSAEHGLVPGRRQHASTLILSLRTSLGEDFAITLPPKAEVTALTHDNTTIPVRKEGDAVVVPLRPGAQRNGAVWLRKPVAGNVRQCTDRK